MIASEPTNRLGQSLADIEIPDMNSMRHLTLQMMKSSIDQTSSNDLSSNLEDIFDTFVEFKSGKQMVYDQTVESAVSVIGTLESRLVAEVSDINVLIEKDVDSYLSNRQISFEDDVKIDDINGWFGDTSCQLHDAIPNYQWISRFESVETIISDKLTNDENDAHNNFYEESVNMLSTIDLKLNQTKNILPDFDTKVRVTYDISKVPHSDSLIWKSLITVGM